MIFVILVIAVACVVVSVAVQARVLLALDAIKAAAEVVAADLAVAQGRVDSVARDLVAQHDRADATKGPHGAQADAAARSGDA